MYTYTISIYKEVSNHNIHIYTHKVCDHCLFNKLVLFLISKRQNTQSATLQNSHINMYRGLASYFPSDLPSSSPLPQLYPQHTGVGEWPEQVEFHPYSAEEESELGYMDDPYHEESYEDLLTPSFFSLERDTLQIVEVTHTVCLFKFG